MQGYSDKLLSYIKISKQKADIFSDYIYIFSKFCVNEGKFPNLFNLIKANVPNLYPLKSLWFSYVFSGYEMEILATNALNKLM